MIARANDWLYAIGADSVHVSPLADSITARFLKDDNRAWQHLPPSVSHPFTFDFVIRRDAGLNGMENSKKARAQKPDVTYTVTHIKEAYGIPVDLQASNESTTQMVWGPGTFGYSRMQLSEFKRTQCPLLNESRIVFDTKNHGTAGGDNYGEGNLDVKMITAFGLNVHTIVSNTNTSSSTEEGNGFGEALLDFITELPSREKLPHVLSISLGSLSAASCDLLCDEAVKKGQKMSTCHAFMQQQRQVCMYLSQAQTERINRGFQILGARGVSVFGSSGDGGSHFSFGPFNSDREIARVLNEISCQFQFPVFPTASPYVTSVGGEAWGFLGSAHPIAWSRSGGGFSWQFPSPAHQREAVSAYLNQSSLLPPASSFNASNRAYPDVAGISEDGTSQSSPLVAGVFSMVTDARLNAGLPPLGYLGPRLYQTMRKFPGEAFQDISRGNSKTSCPSGFGAAKDAWDPVTGWGRPQWSGLLKHFATDDFLYEENKN